MRILVAGRLTNDISKIFLNCLVVIGDFSYGSGQIEYFENNTFTKISPDLHTDAIRYLKYLPYKNGFVASASYDKTVNILNTLTWTSIQRYTSHTDWVFSLDQIYNDTMVSGSFDNTIRIWKISTGETLKVIPLSLYVYAVRVFSIEYKQIACGLNSNNLQIYNYETGVLARTFIGHTSTVRSIEMLSELFMASGSNDQRVIIWDLFSYSIRYTLTGHSSSVGCIKSFSSNLMASGDFNGLIIVWLTGERIFNLTGHTDSLYSNSLDLYDDQTLISGSYDKTAKFWNITNGKLIKSINVDIQISTLAMLKKSE
jgi:WD40 repeat protein